MIEGRPVAFVFYFGLLGKFRSDGNWEFVPNPDTLLVSGMHLIFCAVPLTAWVAATITVLQPTVESGKTRPTKTEINRSAKFASVAALLAITVFNITMMYIKSWNLMGPVSILVSPGFAWSIPMAVGLVVAAMASTRKLSHKRE